MGIVAYGIERWDDHVPAVMEQAAMQSTGVYWKLV